MTDQLYCPECADKWSGAYNSDHRCVTCGSPLKVEKVMDRLKAAEWERDEAQKVAHAVLDQRDELREFARRMIHAAMAEGAGPMMRCAIDAAPDALYMVGGDEP